ncbi:hypothetical protein SK803_21695 [Lentzea sp. BCCO 10_0856]|uniref:Uncharacterized protein n=1 Tax=Lentzea miocenica TaxID=3095431 RepID=A0ABU4T3U9_9PSEU|nr:hypothetical protein [Lentzea sp. BCCO 10_0856]MDX8032839.1 hypothetical protein [Lentzea sp. BCCO 10_0856]
MIERLVVPVMARPDPLELRSSLNKAAYVLALATSRHPGSVNKELNDVMGVDRRAEANKEQLREALQYVGDRLRALAKSRHRPRREDSADATSSESARRDTDVTFSGDPPFQNEARAAARRPRRLRFRRGNGRSERGNRGSRTLRGL